MNRMRRGGAIGGGLLVVLVLGSCDGPPSAPSSGGVRLELRAPSQMPPGGTASLLARVVRSDGSVSFVSREAEWLSSNPAVIAIDAAGQARANAVGEARISARFEGATASADILVLPPDTFRLIGLVTDNAGLGVAGATVKVTAGVGAGASAVTGASGAYALYGVRGRVRIEVTGEGYLPQDHEVDVLDHRSFDLRLASTLGELNGAYTLTMTAGLCGGNNSLPAAAQTRTYTATVTHTGNRLDVVLTGAEFIVTRGRGDRFSGTTGPANDVVFVLGQVDDTFYYFYTAEYDIVERFSATNALYVHGTVNARPTSSAISGRLNGTIAMAQNVTWPYFPVHAARCVGDHAFELRRR